ncbi:sulfatase-like hydrolase/transferase [Photobacterium damselae]
MMLSKIFSFLKKRWILIGSPILFGVLLAICEIIIRDSYGVVSVDKWINPIIFGALLSLIILFSRSIIISIVYIVFITFIYLVQFSNLSYFGYWVSPMDIWLMFEKFTEVSQAGMSVIEHQKLSLFCVVIITISCLLLLKIRRYDYRKYYTVSILGLLLLLFYPVKMVVDKNATLGRLPNINHTVVKTSLYTMGYFFGHTLPEEVLGQSSVRAYTRSKPQKVMPPMSNNIVILMGESLSSAYMSAYGFKEKTTPWLDSQKNMKNRYFTESYSGGLFTDVSVPFFFNLIKKPNAKKQIATGSSNLFRLAKDDGYKTFFYSSQMSSGLSLVSLLGKQWMNDYKDSEVVTHDIKKPADDSQLISWLNHAKLSSNNFIVLNPNGSHEPYIDRSPKNAKVFGSDSLYNEYLNSVHYSDEIIKQLQEKIETLPGTWTFIVTSDHGQNVTKTTAGKGSFLHETNYLVPVYIASNSEKVMQLAQNRFNGCQRIFHVQLSAFVSEIMGYKNDNLSCDTGYVAGKRLTGNSGYMHILEHGNKREIIYN